MSKYLNPYQNQELRYPKEYAEHIQDYLLGKEEDKKKKHALRQRPFKRIVDIWMLALCLGVRNGKRRDLERGDSMKYEQGSIFTRDHWRVNFITTLIVGAEDNVDLISTPRKIIQLANQYAAAGFSELFSSVRDSNMDPLDSLLEMFDVLLEGK